MSSNPLRLQKLLEKYLDNTCTPQELTEFWQLVSEFSDNDVLTGALRKRWQEQGDCGDESTNEHKERIFADILEKAGRQEGGPDLADHKPSWRRRYLLAAAIFGILLAGSWLAFHTPVQTGLRKSSGVVAQDVAPGGNNAVLTLANGRKINLDTATQGAIANVGSACTIQLNSGHLSYRAAGPGTSPGQHLQFNRLSTPRGGQYKLILSDGTKVWLNALSSISFPVTFLGKKRQVTVTGEVYFEVAPDAQKPFWVTVGNTQVQVLGTQFNVNAYADEPESRTTLLEGSIRVVSRGAQHEPASILMKPGEQLRISQAGKTRLLTDADTDESVAWKDGLFVFHNDDLPQVMRRISRWYDVAVVYDTDGLAKTHVTGSIDRNENLSKVLKMLALAVGTDFEIEGRQVIIKSRGPTRVAL